MVVRRISKLVVLSLVQGDLENGFTTVSAELWLDSNSYPMKFHAALPAIPEIPILYRRWKFLYEALNQCFNFNRGITNSIDNSFTVSTTKNSNSTRGNFIDDDFELEEEDVVQVSEVEFRQLCDRFQVLINNWLNSEEFRLIDRKLRRYLDPDDEIRLIIQTNDDLLRRLPWHLWNFFEDYPYTEVALSLLDFQRTSKKSRKKKDKKIKVLAIQGNGEGLNLEKDRTFLEQLSGKAKIEFLVEPEARQLNEQLWEQGWDILFFAGHSSSEEKGTIQINQTQTIGLDKLRNALKTAIKNGLKLAIFNSCDGLALASYLEDLNIPQAIVMREAVPDFVAQEFLRHFLTEFSREKSLYTAVRLARERLESLEDEYPCATWLPVICQNPAEIPMSWSQSEASTPFAGRELIASIVLSCLVTLGVMGLRHLGMLQKWELQAYDQLMRSRPDEGPDGRILVVGITEEDFQLPEQKQRKGSLSDEALAKLLDKLELHKPQAIGLDIFRDFPVDSKQIELKERLLNNAVEEVPLFSTCHVGESKSKSKGVAPPPEILEQHLGFSNVLADSDGVLRRHLLSMHAPHYSACPTTWGLSSQLALHYLNNKGIALEVKEENWRLGKIVLQPLQENAGGYQKADTWGNQILLNYRSYRSPNDIAEVVTLTEVLRDKLKPEFIKDRIILIGVITPTSGDDFLTPYSEILNSSQRYMPGVILHAQMISQILSAVLDGRPLLSPLPLWEEFIFVSIFAVIGGSIGWCFDSFSLLLVLGGVGVSIIYGVSLISFVQGIWLPIVPSVLTFASAEIVSATYSKYYKFKIGNW